MVDTKPTHCVRCGKLPTKENLLIFGLCTSGRCPQYKREEDAIGWTLMTREEQAQAVAHACGSKGPDDHQRVPERLPSIICIKCKRNLILDCTCIPPQATMVAGLDPVTGPRKVGGS